jgi:hypothetical protein
VLRESCYGSFLIAFLVFSRTDRLDKLRGGPPRKQSSRSSSRSETSAKPDALVEDPPPMPGFDGPADALLRRIERHFDANGDGQLDDAEISQMFDTLDEAGTGRLTQGDLRAALTKAHIFTQVRATQTQVRLCAIQDC